MQALYEPRGAAREYAPLAVNLYRGCTHGCRYCYCPGVLRIAREEFHAAVEPRPGILDQLARDLDKRERKGLPRERVHLCFTTDPWAPAREPIIRRALCMLREAGYPISVLTKAGLRALDDLDVLKGIDVHFGVSLVWRDDERRREWEPRAATVSQRLHSLMLAKDNGVQTWASVEPVIDPEEGMAAIEALIGLADVIKIGRWNHDARANDVDWRLFARAAKCKLEAAGQRYMLKRGLAEHVQ